MLYHFLINIIEKNSSLVIYADNCAGQNKNKFLIGFLIYLVKIKKIFPRIELNFLISGHTKFSPDSHFGTIKALLYKGNYYRLIFI